MIYLTTLVTQALCLLSLMLVLIAHHFLTQGGYPAFYLAIAGAVICLALPHLISNYLLVAVATD